MNRRILTLGATLTLLISPVWAQDTDVIADDGSPSRSERLDRRANRAAQRGN